MDEAYQIQWKSSVVNGRELMSATIPCGPHFSAEVLHNKPHGLREQDIFVRSTAAVIVEPMKYQIIRFETMTGICKFSVDLATTKLLEGVMSFFRQANSHPGRVCELLRDRAYGEFRDAMRNVNAPMCIQPRSPEVHQINNHSEGCDTCKS